MPSRACLFRFPAGGVGHELAVDHVGQAAAQAAHRFHRGLGLLESAPVVGPAVGVVAELDDAGHAGHVVDPPVARPGTAGGGVCCPLEAPIGAVPFQDAKWPRLGNRADVTDVGQDPGGAGGPDAMDVHQA